MNGDSSIRIERISGSAIGPYIGEISRLRMAVFRDWPYLYDGNAAYEEDYLAGFASGPGSVIVAALDGDEIIGAATGAPLSEHTEEFGPLFRDHGLEPDHIFYCGESVLLLSYRGRGIGHAFFDHREDHARSLSAGGRYKFTHTTFCGVIRDTSDLRCPADYRPLDDFWMKRGYRKVDGLIGHYDWREIGDNEETRKGMQFWMREL